MLIKELKIRGLLSFGPEGINLPLSNLNVLIGSNGSGKSNLLDVISLLKAAPTNLPAPVMQTGGIWEWMWKGETGVSVQEAEVEAVIGVPIEKVPFLRHTLNIAAPGGRFEVVDERIDYEQKPSNFFQFIYRFQRGNPVLQDLQFVERRLSREKLLPDQSILAQVRDPERYMPLTWMQTQYQQIQFFRNWAFGPNATLRRAPSAHDRSDFLVDGGENLALAISKVRTRAKTNLLESLNRLYADIEDVHLIVDGGNVSLFLEETKGRLIPATRLSDGTLRYLCLLAILLHPEPPPLIAMEEPELGLHPDVVPHVAELLIRASERTQLVVTTHSRMLVDALTEDPSCVVVCEKVDGESRFERLNASALSDWLNKYSLGELWSMGELGGNRW